MKVRASVSADLMRFLDGLVKDGRYESRSHAIVEALRLWRTDRLEAPYARAFLEVDTAWDVIHADGLGEAGTP